jgi:hypothetical protein
MQQIFATLQTFENQNRIKEAVPIPCVTEHPSLGTFPIWDIAKRFYISARI